MDFCLNSRFLDSGKQLASESLHFARNDSSLGVCQSSSPAKWIRSIRADDAADVAIARGLSLVWLAMDRLIGLICFDDAHPNFIIYLEGFAFNPVNVLSRADKSAHSKVEIVVLGFYYQIDNRGQHPIVANSRDT